MKALIIAGTVVALLVTTTATAQTYIQWPAPAPFGTGQKTYFPMGTPLMLRTRTEVNTKQSKPGDRLYLEVAESLSYRGQVVVPIGATVVAEVARSERNGHFGKKGAIDVRLLYVETPSGPVRLTGQASDEGKSAGLWSIGAMVITGGWGWGLIHGTSGYIRHGTPVNAYLAENLSFVHQPEATAEMTQVQPDGVRSASMDPQVLAEIVGQGTQR